MNEPESEIEYLKGEIDDLKFKIAELERSVGESSSDSRMNADVIDAEEQTDIPSGGEMPPLSPFAIGYELPTENNSEYEGWNIYLPDGSVVVDGKTASLKEGGCATNLENDFADFRPSPSVVCNIFKKDEEYEYALSPEADEKAELTVRIASFDEYETEVVKQYHIGVLCVSLAVSANDGELTIGSKDTTGEYPIINHFGTFTANQKDDKTIYIPCVFDGDLVLVDKDGYEHVFSANAKNEVRVNLATAAGVNNGKLTITITGAGSGGDDVVKEFTANQSSDESVTIPAAHDAKLKVKFGADAEVEKFSANASSDSTINFAKVASTGSYNDLTDTPSPVTPGNGALTIKTYEGTLLGTFTANQTYGTLITLPQIVSPLSGTVNFICDMKYDLTTKQIQKRIDTLDLATGVVTPGNYTMITGGQATSHA